MMDGLVHLIAKIKPAAGKLLRRRQQYAGREFVPAPRPAGPVTQISVPRVTLNPSLDADIRGTAEIDVNFCS